MRGTTLGCVRQARTGALSRVARRRPRRPGRRERARPLAAVVDAAPARAVGPLGPHFGVLHIETARVELVCERYTLLGVQ